MTFNPVNPLTESRALDQQVRVLKGQIIDAPSISPGQYRKFSKKLSRASATLQSLESHKASNLFIKTHNAQLKEEVINLHGVLEFGQVEREVSQIQKKSTSLKKGKLTRKAIQQLELHIKELESKYLPSIPDRRVIADAKQTLLDAKAKLEGRPVVKHFDYLAQQKSIQFIDAVHLLPEEVEELYDIARAVYNRDLGAKKSYNKISEANKRIFERHIHNLGALAFDDPLETMQALIATVNELVANGEGYPSYAQIDQLFIELSQLDQEEVTKEGKIFLFSSEESAQA